MQTLEEAKQVLRDNWEEGIDCPCCHRLVKLYRRPLSSGASRSLIILYNINKQNNGGWVHIQNEFAKRKLNVNGMDYGILKWWDFIEPMPNENDPTKKANGYWKITQKGIDFVLGRTDAPSHKMIYDNKLKYESDKKITIRESLGNKFDYYKLMDGTL